MFRQHFGLKFNPFDKEIPTDKLFASRDTKELPDLNICWSQGVFALLLENPDRENLPDLESSLKILTVLCTNPAICRLQRLQLKSFIKLWHLF